MKLTHLFACTDMATNADDHAYPLSATVAQRIIEGYGFPPEYLDMTKMEYFSAMAMQGLAANSTIKLNELETCKVAVRLAKALVSELNR